MKCNEYRVFKIIILFAIIIIINGFALLENSIADERRETDLSGKEWSLENWQDGTRPYPKDLKQREAWYQQKWGEHWAGPRYTSQGGDYIMSPGNWEHEEFAIIPNGKAYTFDLTNGRSQVMIYAPGGDEVTDIYVVVDTGLYYVDYFTKEISFIGNKITGGLVDGLDGNARLDPTTHNMGDWATVDPVTGRVYFSQINPNGGRILRYIEKLLPYNENGVEYLLPAFLDYNNMYTQVSGPNGGALSKVITNGNRAKPHFAVRTTSIEFSDFYKISGLIDSRMMITPDGKNTYVFIGGGGVHNFDLFTGTDFGNIIVPEPMPGPSAKHYHDVYNSRFDNYIYIARHTGSGGGPGRMFRFNPDNGNLEMLYDSLAHWEPISQKHPPGYDNLQDELDSTSCGPADTNTLWFATSSYQVQSPRTGAILNGGWDFSGLRHYHDGFVTSLVQTPHTYTTSPLYSGRPEWDEALGDFTPKHSIVSVGSLMTSPDVAPNGDVFIADNSEWRLPNVFNQTQIDGIRIIRLHRTDWPAEQPVNGYADQFLSQTKRRNLMLEHAQRYINNTEWDGIPDPDTTPSSIPQNLNAVAQNESQIKISWEASNDLESGIIKYNVYRSDSGGKIGETPKTYYVDSSLSDNSTYSYQVTAINGAGLESGMSDSTQATTIKDVIQPYVTSLIVSSNTNIKVVFSEAIDQLDAETFNNYHIDNGIIISNAALATDSKTVILTTSLHSEGINYTLTVNNVKDRAATPNTIAPESFKTYSYTSPIIVSNLNVASGKTYEIVNSGLQVGELIYSDRTYKFTSIPASFQEATYIKTANEDKSSTGNSFLTFNINKASNVYIAYDNRISTPLWLSSFTDTGIDLMIANNAHSIFEKNFEAGTVTLEGNYGSEGSMYSVIVSEGGLTLPADNTVPSPPINLRKIN